MKPFQHILIAVILLSLTGLFLYVQNQSSSRIAELENTVKRMGLEKKQLEIERRKLDPDAFEITSFHGSSMSEFGFIPGEMKLFYNRKCEPGDVCAFSCLVKKCISDYDKEEYFAKRLMSITIKNGKSCYWFEGNTKPYMINGEWFHSFDSKTYGCLLKDEFKMFGVVKQE